MRLAAGEKGHSMRHPVDLEAWRQKGVLSHRSQHAFPHIIGGLFVLFWVSQARPEFSSHLIVSPKSIHSRRTPIEVVTSGSESASCGTPQSTPKVLSDHPPRLEPSPVTYNPWDRALQSGLATDQAPGMQIRSMTGKWVAPLGQTVCASKKTGFLERVVVPNAEEGEFYKKEGAKCAY
ncbi:hypothetical protein BJV78DRAFT_1310788 [Lactifluus subvellereus]|nr:hypothetical protein BJV78DRAFT_1310788 [Lactifluus subvellereus]